MPQLITTGYSPCPNDTFIFYALIHQKINAGSFEFKEILEDVETLNQKALNAELDVTKVSCHAFAYLRERYCFLRSGAALGSGCGPLVVAKKIGSPEDLNGKSIAIPGQLTTAYLLLQLYNHSYRYHVIPMPFYQIMEAVQSGRVDAGLIIHESRFTYPLYGLTEILDLGRWWEFETGLPIPLGGIIAKRQLGQSAIQKIERLIRESILYAFQHKSEPTDYIKRHSQELSDDVIARHIDLYVNAFSIDIGRRGADALSVLLAKATQAGIVPSIELPIFFENE